MRTRGTVPECVPPYERRCAIRSLVIGQSPGKRTMDAMDTRHLTLDDERHQLDDGASIIRLLRVFLGAAVGEDGRDDDPPGSPPQARSSTGALSSPTDATATPAPVTASGGRASGRATAATLTAPAETATATSATATATPASRSKDPSGETSLAREGDSPTPRATPTPPRDQQRRDDGDDPPGPTPQGREAGREVTVTAAAAAVTAREEAGCTLWDMSAEEENASAMCSAGLAAVSCAVLRHCAEAEAESAAEAASGASPPVEEAPAAAGSAAAAAAAAVATDAVPRLPPGEQGAERLREVTCGLLANVCSHRSLRPQVAGNAPLGGELLRAFHSTDDPASLTELLRLFSTAALFTAAAPALEKSAPAAVGEGDGGPSSSSSSSSSPEEAAAANVGTGRKGAIGATFPEEACGSNGDDCSNGAAETETPEGEEVASLASGLASRDTLERLGFFLENALEEKLLAWVCSLAYKLMYRHGDAVIGPLVEAFRFEESLTSLLLSRSADLSYEKLGGAETGLDVLLRCLEVLTTSELSSIGPAGPPPPPPPPPAAAVATAGADEPAGPDRVDRKGDEQQPPPPPPPVPPQKRRKSGGEGADPAAVDAAKLMSKTAMAETTGRKVRAKRSHMRAGVIRGLLAALEPWEHSRRSQRAALLVLGNVLGNALEEDSEIAASTAGGAEGWSASESCAAEVEKGLVAAAAMVAAGEFAEPSEEEAAGGVDRLLAEKRREFQENIDKLASGAGGPEAADEGDGLGEELAEAVGNVKRILEMRRVPAG